MEFNQGKPIYLQIADWMGGKILRGEWRADERIPSVRETAALLRVNPNTAMRAYDALQAEGAIYNKRGIGYFVATDGYARVMERERNAFLTETLPEVFGRMETLGFALGDINEEYEKHKNGKKR